MEVFSFQLQADSMLVLSPITDENALCHGIGPSLTHANSLSGLQTATGSTASHSVGDAMGHFMRDDVVFEGTVAFGLYLKMGLSTCYPYAEKY